VNKKPKMEYRHIALLLDMKIPTHFYIEKPKTKNEV
jgi:hypothetical protein